MARVINATYEDLVLKAQEIFWIKGYKGVSVKHLSEELEVSQSVLYNKYSKDLLFMDSIDYYTSTYSDPFLKNLRDSTEGLDSLQQFFFDLIDALLNKVFPRSCLMVNTVVELRNENEDIVQKYSDYLSALKNSYLVVLEKAYELGQIKEQSKLDNYAEFILGVIFSLSILYKLKTKEELRKYIVQELQFIK
jgi:TetR/AcrR family transcriptional repressor of nem operon